METQWVGDNDRSLLHLSHECVHDTRPTMLEVPLLERTAHI